MRPRSFGRLPRSNQSGVAIAIVVWFIAGMSILVAGIVSHARLDIGMSQLHLARAKAVSAGEGAILLAATQRQRSARSGESVPLVQESSHRVGEHTVNVYLVPARSFIDLNMAGQSVLEVLFAQVADTEPGDAKILADNVVQWRRQRTARGGRSQSSSRFHTVEDLVRVEGINRSQLDALSDYVVAGTWVTGSFSGGVPPKVWIAILERLNNGEYTAVNRLAREALRQGNVSNLPLSFTDRVLRADAVVDYGGRKWLRRQWITMDQSREHSGGWRVLRSETPRVLGISQGT